MVENPFTTIVGVALFLFIGSIFMESTPQARLAKTCSPVRWTGNVMGSISALSDSEKVTRNITLGTDEWDYGCQFTLWRLMYGKEYAKAVKGSDEEQGTTAEQPAMHDEILPPGGIVIENSSELRNRSSGAPRGERIKLIER